MKRMFLIVALAFIAAPAHAQVAFGNHAPGLQLGGVSPPPPNAAPSVPPGGLNPSGTGPGYVSPPGPRASTITPGGTSLGNVGPSVLPSGGTPGIDTGAAGSEAEARAKVAHAGYGSVSAMTRGADGVWRGTAKLNAQDVRVEVDMYGAVRGF